jgi:cell division protease FtsH
MDGIGGSSQGVVTGPREARGACDTAMSEAVGPIAVLPHDGDGPLLPGVAEVSADTQRLIDEEVRRIVNESHQAVTSLLMENRERLDALAAALLEHETLDEADAYAAAGVEHDIPVVA